MDFARVYFSIELISESNRMIDENLWKIPKQTVFARLKPNNSRLGTSEQTHEEFTFQAKVFCFEMPIL